MDAQNQKRNKQKKVEKQKKANKEKEMKTHRVEVMRKETSDRIAASYVVPDLVVAVQEAVYNAIDAHASHVNVVVDAAQATFSVTDDGDGIHPDAMFEYIFKCNASTKVDRSTRKYGSRGQYLVALGTLAKHVELESRMETHCTSFRKVVENARVVFNARSKTTKTTKGTVLRVQNLFWLLPVRQREVEAHASARLRLAKRLGAFFHSLSLIWPTLSIDVSFPETKVARCLIPGVASCEVRLRTVFGDLLGGDLEYINFDVDDLPFTVRGYAAVVRDAGDGDAYVESPGWRQARAYYQYVFLDNYWLEDFQRECCKTINNAAIAVELGIPIFVLKITAKGHEYERHSDGHTQVVNLKRPEKLTQTMRRFVQMLKARVVEADTIVAAMAVKEDENEILLKHEIKAEELPESFYERTIEHDAIAAYSHDAAQLDVAEAETCTEATWTGVEGLELELELDLERDTSEVMGGYGDHISYDDRSDMRYDYDSHLEDYYRPMPPESMDGWNTPPSMAYGAPASAMVYEDVYVEDSSVPSYAGYRGCTQCGSCESYESSSRQYADAHPHPVVYYYPVAPIAVSQPCEYYYEAERYEVVKATDLYYNERQYAEYEPATASDITVYSDAMERADAKAQEEIHQVISAPTRAPTNQQQAFDQLFFGKSLPREKLQPPGSRRRREKQRRDEESKAEADQWVSSRRVGVRPAELPTLDPSQVEHEDARTKVSEDPSHVANKDKDSNVSTDLVKNEQSDSEQRECGSHQLSEYFSLEKLAKAHPRSRGQAISRFAMKRTALAGVVGSCGLEDRPLGVHVAQLPSDLHSPAAKTMTIDKNLLHHLLVIKQVDRKFILVKATHESPDSDSTTLLLCIDQHAADERVRLEQLEMQVFGADGNERNVAIACHAPPLVLSLNARERETLSLFRNEIQSWGFGIGIAGEGNAASLTHTPKIDTRVATVDDFREYLQLLARSDAMVARRVVRPPVLTRFLHSRACRSAVMFGDYLSFSQCQDIVEQLRDCHLPFQCAHGRPSIVPLVELATNGR